jgi:parallel beta-helix repeat protein
MKSILILTIFMVILLSSGYAAGLIDISYSPYTISQPGSYIVVADLTTPQDLDCITIATSDVTIDLNGHTLYGAGSATGTFGAGIYAGSSNNIAVTNGVIRNFHDDAINAQGINVHVSRVRMFNTGGNGINVGENAVVVNNSAYQHGYSGIAVKAGSVVRDNAAKQCTFYGVYLTGNSCTATGNSVADNMSGICSASGGNTIIGNSAYSNDEYGIYLNVSGCIVSNNNASYNGLTGIFGQSGCTIIGNCTYSNGSSGIRVNNGSEVMHNTCRYNSYAGIQVSGDSNSVSQNVCTSNTYGLLSGAGNYFEQNKLRSSYTADESLGGSTEGSGVLANVIIP